MLLFLKTAIGDAWAKALLYGGLTISAVALIWQAYRGVKASGRKEAETETTKRTLSNMETANAARREAEQHQADDIHPDVRKFYRD